MIIFLLCGEIHRVRFVFLSFFFWVTADCVSLIGVSEDTHPEYIHERPKKQTVDDINDAWENQQRREQR